MKAGVTLRVARPTDRLDAITKMYTAGLGFAVLGEFRNHDGFDGVILGHPDQPYHLEFTAQAGHPVGNAPTQDHLLVFYVPDTYEWKSCCMQMSRAGFKEVPSYNPYWDVNGMTFEDLDGYRVVLQNTAWER